MDWESVKKEYETTNISLIDLAAKYDIKYPTIKSRKQRQKWTKNASMDASQNNVKDASKPPRGFPIGNKYAVGHGAPIGNQNALGNNGGPPLGSQNALKHGYYSKFIPIEDIEILESAPGAGSLEKDLALARYKLGRLLKMQPAKELKGTMGSADGAETFDLQDDYYEGMIQKQIRLIGDLEIKIHKMKKDDQLGGDNEDNTEGTESYIKALESKAKDVWADGT